ncbi:RES domain-containing protein [Streptodolium elevatio]|uniref:RES domain-containing protein n=1 Tax=Streptodolium elevatio TaxID=3157996 RepID=A0ABV3DHW6_9ACTN
MSGEPWQPGVHGEAYREAPGAQPADRLYLDTDTTLSRDSALMASWQSFCHIIRHRIRHVFWKLPEAADRSGLGPGEIPPADILREIGGIIAQLDLIRTIPPDHELWRARWHHPDERVATAKALGTLPERLSTRSNRMSPAGIPMFYGATSADTARAEAVAAPAPGASLTVGAFRVSRPATVVDLTKLAPVPSPLDAGLGHLSQCVAFLRDFVEDLAREARPDFTEIDYVPTQVVTEFLLHAWDYGVPVDGIAYRSTQHDGQCVVRDVKSEQCVDPGTPADGIDVLRLTLAPETLRSFPAADAPPSRGPGPA